MREILSLFSRNGKHRKRPPEAENKSLLPSPEFRQDLPPVLETDRRPDETAPKKKDGPKDGNAGPILRITESIRDLAARAEETIREVAGAVSGMGSAGSAEHVRAPRISPSVLSAVPEFRAEVRAEDIPYRRGGFTDETSEGGQKQFPRESVRLLLDRTKEMEEKLFRLNETADEIRKELTI